MLFASFCGSTVRPPCEKTLTRRLEQKLILVCDSLFPWLLRSASWHFHTLYYLCVHRWYQKLGRTLASDKVLHTLILMGSPDRRTPPPPSSFRNNKRSIYPFQTPAHPHQASAGTENRTPCALPTLVSNFAPPHGAKGYDAVMAKHRSCGGAFSGASPRRERRS
jgi:hypothetical protein